MKERESERKPFEFLGLFIFKVPYAQNQRNYFSFESGKVTGHFGSI